MILDAGSLTTFQSCRREFLLSHDYLPKRWRAKSLFDHCLRAAIFALSSGADPAQCATEASTKFMQVAADPGLELPTGNPYVLAKDFCAMFETILRSLARLNLLVMHKVPVVRLNSSIGWGVRAWADDSGVLHRWITIDSWGEDDLSRELHSWWTAGDMAATGQGMTVHVVEIGQVRKGRRASPWARGWRHPNIPAIQSLRFARPEGKGFQGWDPVWFTEARVDADEWVDQMWRDGAAQALVHHVVVKPLGEAAQSEALAQVLREAVRMREMIEDRGGVPWQALPMSRGACDGFVPCVYQDCCYRSEPVDPEATGLYVPRQAQNSQLVMID